MSRDSIKHRLTLALQRDLEREPSVRRRRELARDIQRLGQRGSGALPRWARLEAERRGIE